jgi:hypothetical protein
MWARKGVGEGKRNGRPDLKYSHAEFAKPQRKSDRINPPQAGKPSRGEQGRLTRFSDRKVLQHSNPDNPACLAECMAYSIGVNPVWNSTPMKRVFHKSKRFKEAEEWDVLQHAQGHGRSEVSKRAKEVA